MCNDDSLHFDKSALTGALKSKAFELGFSACGVAKAGPVDAATANHIRRWLAEGGNAGMDYMSNNLDKRLDPRLLMTDVKSIVSFALNYTPGKTMPGRRVPVCCLCPRERLSRHNEGEAARAGRCV